MMIVIMMTKKGCDHDTHDSSAIGGRLASLYLQWQLWWWRWKSPHNICQVQVLSGDCVWADSKAAAVWQEGLEAFSQIQVSSSSYFVRSQCMLVSKSSQPFSIWWWSSSIFRWWTGNRCRKAARMEGGWGFLTRAEWTMSVSWYRHLLRSFWASSLFFMQVWIR